MSPAVGEISGEIDHVSIEMVMNAKGLGWANQTNFIHSNKIDCISASVLPRLGEAVVEEGSALMEELLQVRCV